MFKVNNRNTRTRCEICSKLTIKTPEQRPENLISLLKLITPPKSMKRKIETCSKGVPIDEGNELFDCEGDRVTIEEQDMEDQEISDDDDETISISTANE